MLERVVELDQGIQDPFFNICLEDENEKIWELGYATMKIFMNVWLCYKNSENMWHIHACILHALIKTWVLPKIWELGYATMKKFMNACMHAWLCYKNSENI